MRLGKAIRISVRDPRSFGSWYIKGAYESTLSKNSSVPLIHYYPSDLESMILTSTIPKEPIID